MQTNKFVVVLIHGHGVDASIWDGIYADLVLETTVLKPDFARSTTHATIEGYAEDLYAQLQAIQAEKAVLVGHSMGGYIALAFADRYPDMVQGLVLYHSTPVADDENRREVRRQAIAGLKTDGTAPFIQKQLPKMVSPAYPDDKIQTLINRYLDLPADALIAGMTAMLNRPDRTHVLRTATFPVLLVLGRDDQIIPYDKTAQLADLSSQVSVVPIEQAGHLSMVEQPEASLNVLQTFLRKF
ncbi:alpha/beta fold hydrolase [Spirosoma sp. KNUC1025]|uniref:alpha/beta fold hydrolase n=1 Tax=Spirosoma sp. KNUC1025 TaxID=2894082 RepID=UPI0038689BEE|nr:alpha/beta hydrolase [Spirosoma sp. KNUC1025]